MHSLQHSHSECEVIRDYFFSFFYRTPCLQPWAICCSWRTGTVHRFLQLHQSTLIRLIPPKPKQDFEPRNPAWTGNASFQLWHITESHVWAQRGSSHGCLSWNLLPCEVRRAGKWLLAHPASAGLWSCSVSTHHCVLVVSRTVTKEVVDLGPAVFTWTVFAAHGAPLSYSFSLSPGKEDCKMTLSPPYMALLHHFSAAYNFLCPEELQQESLIQIATTLFNSTSLSCLAMHSVCLGSKLQILPAI